MTWSLRSLSSSSQNMWVRSVSPKLNKLLLFFHLWSVCFSQECSQWAHLAKKEIVALEYTAEPVLTAIAAWNLSLEMVTDLC